MPHKTEKHLGVSSADPCIAHRSSPQAQPLHLCYPSSLPIVAICAIVRDLVGELLHMPQDGWCVGRTPVGFQRQTNQIAMYICVVVLSFKMPDVGMAFGRNRSTVRHACMRVEDQRDHPQFDQMVERIEKLVSIVFANPEVRHAA